MSAFNEWFLSLPEGRQKVLRDDKWNLAEAAFNHATAERDEAIAELEQQNAELMTQVAGRDALLNNLSKWIGQLPVPTKSATSWLIRIDGVMKESPAQCLRQIQADAAVKGWWACWHWVDSDDRDKPTLIPAVEEYAAKVRQGVEL